MANTRICIFLLQAGIKAPTDALNPEKSATRIDIEPEFGNNNNAAFWVSATNPRPPEWTSFMAPIIASEMPASISTSTASGLLIFSASNRFFAITFGYGRNLLDISQVEPQFGLRVVLNRVDPTQLRSMDAKTFDDLVISRSTQLSRESSTSIFGIDTNREILRSVTGKPTTDDLGTKISGSSSLILSAAIRAQELPSLASKLLSAFTDESYKGEFGWIDQLSLVESKTMTAKLDALLIAELQSGLSDSTHLAIPESIAWEDISCFKIAGSGQHEYPDLDLDEYLKLTSGRSTITKELLKSRKIHVKFSRNDEFEARWNFYDCLISEQRADGTLYALIEGRWFAISNELSSEVDRYMDRVQQDADELSPAVKGESEGDYNARIVSEHSESLLLLDKNLLRPQGASSTIEVCDILSRDGTFVHVKRKTRSSTLSHLFSQGTVSAEIFANDPKFRDSLRDQIAMSLSKDPERLAMWQRLVPANSKPFERSKYGVKYAIITDSKKNGTDWLPFFSKLNLMQHGRQLSNLGIQRVSLTRIAIDPT